MNCFPARITIRSEILLTMLEKYFYHKRKLIYNIDAGFLLKEIYLIYIIFVITWIDPLNILNRIDSMTYGSRIRFIFIQINEIILKIPNLSFSQLIKLCRYF